MPHEPLRLNCYHVTAEQLETAVGMMWLSHRPVWDRLHARHSQMQLFLYGEICSTRHNKWILPSARVCKRPHTHKATDTKQVWVLLVHCVREFFFFLSLLCSHRVICLLFQGRQATWPTVQLIGISLRSLNGLSLFEQVWYDSTAVANIINLKLVNMTFLLWARGPIC